MAIGLLVMLLPGCDAQPAAAPVKAPGANTAVPAKATVTRTTPSRKSTFKQRLSDYGLFNRPMSALRPAPGVVLYELNTPLFSDYSQKQRLVWLPPGAPAAYRRQGPFDFPVGTIIAKTFYYENDMLDPTAGRRLIETRILERRDEGWVGIPYLWNDAQTEASLAITGAAVPVAWKHENGTARHNTHVVPNVNDCKRCHTSQAMQPIGPKAGNLNRDVAYADGSENQLAHWSRIGILTGAPVLADSPKLAVWNDPHSGSVNERARAYLDVNCAHCHQADGPARNSGLHLNVDATDPYHLGVFKTPVAAGRGTGGRLYSIVPGKPDESILEYRMQSVKSGEVMPEFGKALVHDQGLALIRQWIAEMK